MVNEINKEFENFLISIKAIIDPSSKGLLVKVFCNAISPQSIIQLCEFIKQDTSIVEMRLFWNSLGDEGSIALAEAIKVNKTLTLLELSNNNIGAKGAKALAEAIKVNTALTSVVLKNNNLEDESAIAIAEALKVNKSLTSIDLRANNIGVKGANALAEGLKVSTALTSFKIGSFDVRDKFIETIAEAIKVRNKITSFKIFCGNYIGVEGIKALSELIKANKSLTKVDIFSYNIYTGGINILVEALMVNKNIINFTFDGEKLDIENKKNINNILIENKKVALGLAKFILEGQTFSANQYAALLDRKSAVQKTLSGLVEDKYPANKAKELVDAKINECQRYGFRTIGVAKNSYVKGMPPEIIGNIFSYITEGKDIPRVTISKKHKDTEPSTPKDKNMDDARQKRVEDNVHLANNKRQINDDNEGYVGRISQQPNNSTIGL